MLCRVRQGRRLAHLGQVFGEGTVLELPDAIAADHAVREVAQPLSEMDAAAQMETLKKRIGDTTVSLSALQEQLKGVETAEKARQDAEAKAAADVAKRAAESQKGEK